ncbi:N(2)-acetyl-L-2,4-diaminobutanoate deacetylase DoeB [Sneathiella sp.]|uniref:N(2)-acetyl-L-2,4-diaminobutanoate deacetylase DoeB n=1 Tax=Sneathiella sp. TaxID=1964365 RepID=UPI002617CCA8|nr:N(2)-acetyl-L-2,4-diaminobutanoate deacetylase DoeB [Sneathiella sp.]MDF2366621.1 N(2)-acetyl-L-2,4-diaminobutanoate deacetylase DoeB [Sneathiella sp.]
MRANPISATVNYDEDGVQHGFLKLPYSHDGSAWGSIMIPITVARNGDGPTVLLTGGNHGDEYEGPVALFDLARTIKYEDISGRVIIVPGMNYPAFRAARRTSPIDSGNMNRTFPGNPAGTVTEKIADYFQRTLLPLADYVLDIHSGGKTLKFVPFCAVHFQDDKVQEEKCVAAMRAFNAPFSMMLLEVDSTGMFDTAAEEMGKIFISTELGGGGSTTVRSVAIAKRGVKNFLHHAGVLAGEPEGGESVALYMPDHRCFISSETTGLLELCVDLGDVVMEGQLLARVYDMERTGSDPTEYISPMEGIFAARHFPGLIGMGDIVGVVAVKA